VVVIYKEFTFQATGSDQAFGYGLMATAGIIFTYYTLWIVIMVRKLFSVVIYPLPKTRNVTHLCAIKIVSRVQPVISGSYTVLLCCSIQ